MYDKLNIDIKAKTFLGNRTYLKGSGALDSFETVDLTPVLGTEFVDARLAEWMFAPNADAMLRDLAIKSVYYQVKADEYCADSESSI
jgi:hypothetical protein